MDSTNQRGRPRSNDSILMGIKAIVLEAKRNERHMNSLANDFFQRILATYSHGDQFSQKIYAKKIKEIEEILNGKSN